MKLSRVICRPRRGKRFSLQIVGNTGLPNTLTLVKYSCLTGQAHFRAFVLFRFSAIQISFPSERCHVHSVNIFTLLAVVPKQYSIG